MSRSLTPTFRLSLAFACAFALAGCETLEKINPFGEKETPLVGDRRPVFPQGVPGVSYSEPVAQPSNANIAVPAGGTSAPAAAPSTPRN
ncbi:MAG: hypothetical protein AB1592_00710 [Pseudomonadota bacterium]